MELRKHLVFVDAETDGLYGPFISVAMKVIDRQSGVEVDSFYYGIAKEALDIKEEWVKQNVLPYLGEYENCASQEELLQKVWDFWGKYRADSYAIADVCFPVEARLFSECVKLDEENRRYCAPFPLLDLSTMLFQHGIDPNIERGQLLKELLDGRKHNAMADVDMSVQIWKQLFHAAWKEACNGSKL